MSYYPKTSGPIRIQNLLNHSISETSYAVEFLYVIRNSSKEKVYSVISSGFGQTWLGMSKVRSNSESASSQE